MTHCALALALLSGVTVQVEEVRYRRLQALKSRETFPAEYRNFRIVDIHCRFVESLVRISRSDEYWDSLPDTERQVLERQEVLQVTVGADVGPTLSEDAEQVDLRFNLPLEALPEEVVDRLRRISGMDWLWSDHSAERRALATKWVRLSVEGIHKKVRTLDPERSRFSHCAEDCWDGEGAIVGKDVLRTFQRVTVTPRP